MTAAIAGPAAGSYDEALERLHRTGPEFAGWLSNHGPMAVEALARRGAGTAVSAWTDDYLGQLDDLPRGRFPIADDGWSDPLGDPTRTGDWVDFFRRQVRQHPWQQVVGTWWPRLLPGIAAGATHGVIRLGHALRAARTDPTEPRVDEIAHALAYWAARFQPVPLIRPQGTLGVGDALLAVPPIPDRSKGIRHRLRQLGEAPGWAHHATQAAGPTSAEDVPAALARLVDATVAAYPRIAHGNATMLVHAATAPNAVQLALPSLPQVRWLDAYAAAWTATSAVVAAYRPDVLAPAEQRSSRDPGAEEVWDLAVADGGEHIVKLADTALDVWSRTGDERALRAIETAIRLGA